MYYHILNGDALKYQFPKQIEGQVIVARECLMDGDVSGDTLDDFFNTRANFISSDFGESKQAYFDKTVSQFNAIINLPFDAEIILWFEQDLFCQVNLWFVCSLLATKSNKIYLVLPKAHTKYSFGNMNHDELIAVFNTRTTITGQLQQNFAHLWYGYKANNWKELAYQAQNIRDVFPFVKDAVEAHFERYPNNGQLGRPEKTLQNIINQYGTDFKTVFKVFNDIEGVYGFGDVQVKKMFDKLVNHSA